MWRKLMSKVDMEEPSPIIDQGYWGCTQRESESNKRIVAGVVHQTCFIQHEHDHQAHQ